MSGNEAKMKMTPEQKALFDALTPLQKEVCANVLAGMKLIDAYKASSSKAGSSGSAKSAVSEMMKRPDVVAFMDAMQEAAVSAAVMTRQEALERLSSFARIDLSDLVEFGSYELGDADGQPITQTAWKVRDSVLQDPAKLAAIAELNATKDGIKIKTHSPLQAIQQLAKMQGWESATKHEHSGPGGGQIEHCITVSFVSADEPKH